MIQTDTPHDTALLVGVELPGRSPGDWSLHDSLAELAQLASTVQVQTVATLTQTLRDINPATLIGKGKAEELLALRLATGANIVIFDEELSPRQQRELEKLLGPQVKLLDRTALILDIFAQHANTREGALQVELAQYQYRLPRLTRQWTHLARQTGGGGGRGGNAGVGLRGPGETQLEVDKREISRRISHLKSQLEEVRQHRQQHRQRRRQAALPVVSLVGYTNAGKSTLLNALTGAHVHTADQLFATLDPTTRRLTLPGGRQILLTDTVGFIQKLPTDLIAAFRATLEEVSQADLLLHIIDSTHPNAAAQAAAVLTVLADLDAADKPIITALNKIDRLPPGAHPGLHHLRQRHPDSLLVSALSGEGLENLAARIEETLTQAFHTVRLHIPYSDGDMTALFHQRGLIEEETYHQTGVTLTGRLPAPLAPLFARYRVGERKEEVGRRK